ncbi:two-component system sensor histidine kinase NtrB [Paenibacillus taiwanensis]|uniref:two-component system sensor histidine kinase NtrB n=1 Tax=Paenibacillus taiwanensis TaxID=401638 RepID=UPI0003F8EA41|nr:ATP-binding protein [Paenibacillus taiwanensis]
MNGISASEERELVLWKQRYSRSLRRYIVNGHEQELEQAREAARSLTELQPNDVLNLHEDTMSMMLTHVELDEAEVMFHRSYVYFMECLSVIQAERGSKEGNVLSIDPIREPWMQSAQSLFANTISRNKYENVLQQMDSAIVLFDDTGILSFINVEAAKLLHVPRKELVGCTLLEVMRHPSISREKRKLILRMYRETIVYRKRYHEFVDKQGRTFLVTFTHGEQMDGDYLFSIKDVSDYKRIEQTAVQNDKLAILGKIAAAIAHEIRNPLTSIRGFIQLLRPHLMQLGKEEYARIILAEIDRANDIIFEFLNSSKPTAPLTSEIPISSLLREVVLLTESEALMKGCEIILLNEIQDSTLLVSIDVKQIKQVLLNMIRNAIDALDEVRDKRKGAITLRTVKEGRYVAIHIVDNGKGMDERTLERLFDPFFTTKEEGTGLGLSVSYRIIRNHGGTIEVDSRQNEWTEFIIRLPLNGSKPANLLYFDS